MNFAKLSQALHNRTFAIIASVISVTTIVVVLAAIADAHPLGHEAQGVLDALLAPPMIKPEAGFSAKMLIPPGELSDPQFMVPHGQRISMNIVPKAFCRRGGAISIRRAFLLCESPAVAVSPVPSRNSR